MRKSEETPNGYGTKFVSTTQRVNETTTQDYQLHTLINLIESGKGKFAHRIAQIRAAVEQGDKDSASEHKRQLPGVMFSGRFSKRSSKDLLEHSGMICMDIDKIEDPQSKVDELRQDPHVIVAFVSPSGNGLKAIIAIPADAEIHQHSFESAKNYLSTYGLEADESGKDVSRLCFLSHDPEVHYNPEAIELPIRAEEPKIQSKPQASGDRIGDRYESAPNIRERSIDCLHKLGWQIGRGDSERTYCTRPGKNSGVSGELRSDGSFFCYSDNASPLEPYKNYGAFALYTITHFSGDFRAAAIELAKEFGDARCPDPRDYFNKKVPESQPAEQEIQQERKNVVGQFPVWQRMSECPKDLKKLINQRYPVLVDGVLHRNTKMVLGGGSKSYKTWTLLNLAASVASGQPWFGKETAQIKEDVIFINFEVPHEFFMDRARAVCEAMGIEYPENLLIWSLRDVSNNLTVILEVLKERLTNGCALLCIDPIYKALGDRDENSAGDMGILMQEVNDLIKMTGAAVAFGAHYSKGNQAEKDPLDRISGSGVFARDPDTIMGLTAHEEDSCFTVHSALRNFPGRDAFVVEWDFPLFKIREELDPNKLKKHGQKINDGSIIHLVKERSSEGIARSNLVEILQTEHKIAQRTAYRKIDDLIRKDRLMEVNSKLYTSTNA